MPLLIFIFRGLSGSYLSQQFSAPAAHPQLPNTYLPSVKKQISTHRTYLEKMLGKNLLPILLVAPLSLATGLGPRNSLGTLLIRQSGSCPSNYPEVCDDSCMPAGSVCCHDGNGDFCPAAEVCNSVGCCPIGETCSGGGGTETVGGGGLGEPTPTPQPTTSSAEPTPTSGSGSDGTCPADYPEVCDDSCMPAGSVCCHDGNGDFCPAGEVCNSVGCCPIGETCSGGGGTQTVGGIGEPTPTSSSSSASSSSGSSSSGSGSSGSGSSGSGSSGSGSSGSGSSGSGSSGSGSSGSGSSGSGSSGSGTSSNSGSSTKGSAASRSWDKDPKALALAGLLAVGYLFAR